jgi:hypothetical protein
VSLSVDRVSCFPFLLCLLAERHAHPMHDTVLQRKRAVIITGIAAKNRARRDATLLEVLPRQANAFRGSREHHRSLSLPLPKNMPTLLAPGRVTTPAIEVLLGIFISSQQRKSILWKRTFLPFLNDCQDKCDKWNEEKE